MEYTLKMTVSPTDQEDVYAARIFVAIDEDDRHVETVQIWEANLVTKDPDHTADARLWASRLLEEIQPKIQWDALSGHIAGKGQSLPDLRKPNQHLLY